MFLPNHACRGQPFQEEAQQPQANTVASAALFPSLGAEGLQRRLLWIVLKVRSWAPGLVELPTLDLSSGLGLRVEFSLRIGLHAGRGTYSPLSPIQGSSHDPEIMT